MKRFFFLFGFITVLISNVSAQFNGAGFYRVQNYGTQRYLYLTDNTGSYDMARDVGDFGALQLYKGQEKTISDPSCILYITQYGSQIDIQGQGVGIHQLVNRYVDLKYYSSGAFAGTYTVSASESGITKYLDDEETNRDFPNGVVGTNRSSPYWNWLIHPVNSSNENYFGITPLFSVNGKYYYPLYVAFPFKPASTGIKVYTIGVCDLDLGYAVLNEITGVVPSLTPVLVECSSNSPSDNRLDLVESSATPPSNQMKGVLFCNYDRRIKSANAVTVYNQSKMRMLGLTSEGKLGFVKSTQYLKQIEGTYYLPANTSYLSLPSEGPNELTVITVEEYNEITANQDYTITYLIDGQVYKTEQLKFGQPINADNPTREGYIFSGWSGLPATMPDHDITVTGSFTGINYNITYELEGEVYKVVTVPCGSIISPLVVTKEGYVFSGWNGLPDTMPNHDITVSGYFTIGTYKLIYVIDGEEYQTETYTYGDAITPLGNPSRDGYTFNGWSTIPETMPGHDVTITGSYTPLVYTIKYMIDGQLFDEQQVPCGQTITPPTAPAREGYHFKEWEGLPSAMTAGNLTVKAVYEPNIYNVTYVVDGETYQVVGVPYGSVVTPIVYPEKEGYNFSGWSQLPETMPANDITVTGTFTIGTYKLQYVINGAGYKDYVYFSRDYKFGQAITPYTRTPSAINGYTFSGWDEVPATMPGHDVNIYGTFKGNDYTITYMVDNSQYKKVTVACGDPIPEVLAPAKTGYTFLGWDKLPSTMPASNLTVYAKFKANIYKVSYYDDGKLVYQQEVAYGEPIPAYSYRSGEIEITDADWQGTRYTSMPAKDIIYTCPQDIVDRLTALSAEEKNGKMSFDLSGKRVSAMKAKGIYIINGKKVLRK